MLDDAQRQAERLIREAEENAGRVTEEARRQGEALASEARRAAAVEIARRDKARAMIEDIRMRLERAYHAASGADAADDGNATMPEPPKPPEPNPQPAINNPTPAQDAKQEPQTGTNTQS